MDALRNEIKDNQRIMRALPPSSPQYKKLNDRNYELGQQIAKHKGLHKQVNTETGGPAWEKIADILAGISGGADTLYRELTGIQKAFVQQETSAIWKLIWEEIMPH